VVKKAKVISQSSVGCLVMLVMSVMKQHKVIRYNVWEESFVWENCTYKCCVALYNSDDIQYNVTFTIYTVLYYYIIVLVLFHASFNFSQM
jgi:hypothetical protein